jgi:hypothetical protein
MCIPFEFPEILPASFGSFCNLSLSIPIVVNRFPNNAPTFPGCWREVRQVIKETNKASADVRNAC